ncbi:hypothetical protein ACFVYV_08995 [Streptomyces mirabilis]|uniref:hypothetical protein n=1 Tax=Streptomyces mirabilis TaxID=68239 RepID=UPI0036D90FF3
MTAHPYCRLECENGEAYDDPSEDLIFDLMRSFEPPNNSHLIIEGVDGCEWYVVAALLEEGVYEVEFRDPARRVHRVDRASRLSEVANDMIVWISDTVRYHEVRASHPQPM